MSVDWILTGSKYEISSKNHLLQLMSNGTLFSDTGSPPTDYWNSDYVQVSDVDLEMDSNTTPIGSSSEPFSGSFDGSGYSVTDWSYQNGSEDNVGLFGYVSESTIENVSLEGTWILNGGSNCGFLIGSCESTSSVHNVIADFSSGYITSSGNNIGGLVGSASASTLEGLTMKGSLSSISGVSSVGGVVGSITTGTNLNFVRNMIQFTGSTAISGDSCAGVCANVSNSDCTFTMNAMIGSISGVYDAGGIFCKIQNTSTNSINRAVNSMTGDISSTDSSGSSGGVASSIQSDGTGVFNMNTLVNYSSGSISGGQAAGGVSGSVIDGVEITNSVVAMNGSLDYAGVQTSTGSNNSVEIQLITGFGLNHTNPGVDIELTALTGSFGLHAGFPLQYFPIEGVDTIGNNYIWEFVFGNTSGSVEYSQYSHIVISSGDLSGPIEIHLNLQDHSVDYVYFMNIETNEVVTSPGLLIGYSSGLVFDTTGSALYPVPPLFLTVSSPFSVNLSWADVPGSTIYRVDFGSTPSGSLNRSVTTDSSSVEIFNLDASVESSFQVYSSSDGDTFTIEIDVMGSVTMPANEAGNYILSRFLKDDVYDFSSFSIEKTTQVASIMPSLLGQDESVLMRVNGQVKELLVSGVSGGAIDVTDGDQYVLPFQISDGSGQSLTLEGLYEGSLEYDEFNDSLTIDGQLLSSGDSLIIGNTRITLKSI